MNTDNIASLAAARAAKKKTIKPPPPEGDDGRPVIRIAAGDIAGIIDAADDALVRLDDGLYRQSNRVVRVIWEKVKVSGGREGDILRLSTVTAPHLVERFTAAARWEKWDGRSEDWTVVNCPPSIAEIYLARDGQWKLPFILGVVTTPLLRIDGSVIDKPGYDPGTGILFNPLGIDYPKMIEHPTKDDALEALELLKKPIRDFPFSNPPSHAVALSGIMSTLMRRSLPTVPMHGYSAPTAGSGKSLLVDIASVIATGGLASVTSTGRDKFGDAELEKRLTASMLGGDAVLSIDNLETPLGGELLCQLLTQTSVKLRTLGKSVNTEVPVTTSFFATGNNLTVVGDLTRRVLIATLEVDDERPELRTFDFHPIALVREFRTDMVKAIITIIRAYMLSGERVHLTPLGSFEEWSRMIREPLVWLGEADPVEVLDEVRKNDPRLSRLRQVMSAWDGVFGGRAMKVRDVVSAAMENEPVDGGKINPDLWEAVMAIGGGDKFVSNEKVSWWLRKNAGRVVDGKRFERADDGKDKPEWRLVGGSEVAAERASPRDMAEQIPF